MARDYAKAKHKNAAAPARWRWLLIGLVIGFGVAGIMYLKFNINNIESASTWLNEHSKSTNSPSSKPLSHNSETPNKTANVAAKDKLHFDFYTVLPKMEVKSEAKAAPKMQPVEPVATADLPAKPASAPSNDHPTINNSGALKQAETSLLAPPASSSKKNTSANHDDETKSTTDPKPVATTSHKKTETTTATANESASTSSTTSATSNTNQIIQVGSFQKYESADQLRAQLTMIGVDAHIKSVKEHGVVWKKVWLGPFSSAADLAKVQKQLQENGIKGSIKPYSP